MNVLAVLLGMLMGFFAHPPDSYFIAKIGRYTAFLPNPQITPGLTRADVTAENVCHGGSTRQYRHTSALVKAQAYRLYGAKKKPGICCEVDHLISLELGGADDIKNLWPEPYEPRPGAYEKDEVENYLHAQVCSGAMKLGEAQKAIASNWLQVYATMPHAHASGEVSIE